MWVIRTLSSSSSSPVRGTLGQLIATRKLSNKYPVDFLTNCSSRLFSSSIPPGDNDNDDKTPAAKKKNDKHHHKVLSSQKPGDSNQSNDDHPQNKSSSGDVAKKDGLSPDANHSVISNMKEPPDHDPASSATAIIVHDNNPTHRIRRKGIPDHVPEVVCIPVTRRPLIPGFYKTINIKNPSVINRVHELVRKGTPYIGAFLQREDATPSDTISSLGDIYSHGVFCSIINILPMAKDQDPSEYEDEDITEEEDSQGKSSSDTPDINGVTLIVFPHRRVLAVEKVQEDDPDVSVVRTSLIVDEPVDKRDVIIKALTQEIFVLLAEISKLSVFFREHLSHHGMAASIAESPSALSDFVAVLCSGEPSELQAVLSATSIEGRLRAALVLLKKESVTAHLQASIRRDVEAKINQRQREHVLHEQLKVIKKELGLESDAKEKIMTTFKERLKIMKENGLSDSVFSAIQEEVSRLSVLEQSSMEFNITRSYVDWLTSLPWTKLSSKKEKAILDDKDENGGQHFFGIKKASDTLDKHHYGCKDVKERILEALAVGRLTGSIGGKILCLVGPPGVGKTSIGRSIAEALGRPYARFSVGGLSDVAEIKGHRRTYVGAMPGKIVQLLKKSQVMDPLILIDEVDKIGRGGHQGDPTAALLEVLDPEQNSSFLDHYLDIPVDLGKVFFVTTANTTDTIPPPLLDRMEIITLSGYTTEEKMHIARKHLIPRIAKDTGISTDKEAVHTTNGNGGLVVCITDDALVGLMSGWCRESGVRSLKKSIDKIYRKAALDYVRNKDDQRNIEVQNPHKNGQIVDGKNVVVVEKDGLVKYVSQPIFTSDRMFGSLGSLPVGVSAGLAWTSMGGAALYIETIIQELMIKPPPSTSSQSNLGSGRLLRTGQLGKVMEESASIAHSVAKMTIGKMDHKNMVLSSNLHMHVPEGATPKDGPSAGITMTASLLSLALSRPISTDIAMTGELTLSGKILKIGGLKEKVIAAKREGFCRVIFPKSNLGDWNDLSDDIKSCITPISVDDISQVIDILFPNEHL